MDKLHLLTCTPEQGKRLVLMEIIPNSILWHVHADDSWQTVCPKFPGHYADDMVPAWTFAELAAMIGPWYAKPDLWNEQRRDKSATDPNTYPVFMPDRCLVYTNSAQAAAQGLIFILENNFITPAACNERYMAVFNRL